MLLALGLSFISAWGFGGIRKSAPIRRLVSRKASSFMIALSVANYADYKAQSLHVQRAIICAAAGECLMGWAEVEQALHSIFVDQVVRQSKSKQRYVLAHNIWSTVISFDARSKLVETAIDANFSHLKSRRYRQLRTYWHLLYNYVVSMSKLRNEIAHGTVVNWDDEIKIAPFFTNRPVRNAVSFEEIGRRTDQFAKLAEAIRWFNHEFLIRWRPSPRQFGLKPRPTPHLVRQLRKEEVTRNRDARKRQRMKAQRRTFRRKSRSHR
jgi:hypothetical protein